MITSPNNRPVLVRSYRPTTALAQAVTFDDSTMHVQLTDWRTVSVPLLWFPRLHAARPEQRLRVEIGGGGRGLHWDERRGRGGGRAAGGRGVRAPAIH